MRHTNKKTLLLSLIFVSTAAFADGRIEGKVTAQDGDTNLEGAQIRIADLNRTERSTRDGRFAFANVPSGTYDVVVEYLGTEPTAMRVQIEEGKTVTVDVVLGTSTDEIIVRGARSGTASSLNKQRTSDNVVSIISADAIGALPDANVAEALQRVPGIFLERDQGEGRFIGIRGIDPNLNVTTINGLLVPSPESGARSVALDVIPADLLEGLEVSKTFTPDMEASAIGGAVNVRSLSAFDRNGRSLTMSAEASDNRLVKSTSPKFSGAFTDVFDFGGGEDNLGIAIGASWFDREFGSDNIETDGGWPNDLETVAGAEFKGAEEIEQRSYDVTRERVGLAINFDLRSESGRYYLRNLYSEFSDQEYRTRNEFKFDDGDAISGSASAAQWDDAVVEKSMKDRLEEQNITSIVVGGENYYNAWTFDYSYGYSMSEELEPSRLDTTFEIEDVDIGYSSVGSIPTLTTDPAMSDAANFALAEFEFLDGRAEDTANTFKFNALYDLFSDAYNGSIKFGALQRNREKQFDADVFIYDGPDNTTLTPFATSGPRYSYGNFGPGISSSALRDFFTQNRNSLDLDAEDSLVESLVGNYTMNEDVTAAYLMSTFERENLRIVYGVRYEDTSFDATGLRIVADDINGSGDPTPVPVSFKNDYDHVLPSINARLESGNLVFRAAATQTVARPNFGELSPGGEIVFEDDNGESVFEAEIGNPLLEPIEALNIDFGVEWYPGDISLVSAGVFYKELDNFIVIADVADTIDLTQFVGNTPIDDAEVIQPINGNQATLLGAELGVAQQFENGLYLSGNATFIDSEASYPDRSAKTVLPRTPELVMNGTLGWENELLSLRLAATYRDDALQGFEDAGDPDFDVYQDEHLQFDFSARWNISESLQLSFAAVNLTDEPYYAYFGSRQYNAQYEEYGRTYSIGLRFTPF